MLLPEKCEDGRRRSTSTGEGTEIVVVIEDDPIVHFLLKDLDQEDPATVLSSGSQSSMFF